MAAIVVNQRLVDFVANHQIIMLLSKSHDVDELVVAQNSSDRVPGCVEQDDVGARDPCLRGAGY